MMLVPQKYDFPLNDTRTLPNFHAQYTFRKPDNFSEVVSCPAFSMTPLCIIHTSLRKFWGVFYAGKNESLLPTTMPNLKGENVKILGQKYPIYS